MEGQEPLKAEISAFVDCVREKKSPLVSGADGLRALEAAYQVLDSLEGRSW